jgi:hypothetical protein
MDELRITSWTELHERLFDDAWQPALGRHRSGSAFRGMSCRRYALETSLSRLGPGHGAIEAPMLRAFRRYAHQHDAGGDSVWNWLTLGQHHGLPTRLLDWTYSPYVALHFATRDLRHYHEDAIIWSINYSRSNALLDPRLRDLLEREGTDVFTTDLLRELAPTLPEFDALAPETFLVFFEPPSLDDRIVNQYALFSVMSDATARLDDWVNANPDCARRIVIPAALKWEVRDKLDQANITERVLFPGLDGLSAWLRRYYTPRAE